jgi:hypothetical protein
MNNNNNNKPGTVSLGGGNRGVVKDLELAHEAHEIQQGAGSWSSNGSRGRRDDGLLLLLLLHVLLWLRGEKERVAARGKQNKFRTTKK